MKGVGFIIMVVLSLVFFSYIPIIGILLAVALVLIVLGTFGGMLLHRSWLMVRRIFS